MPSETPLRALLLPGVAALPEADWTACLPEEAEGWRYHRACEAVAAPAAAPLAAGVFDADGLVLGARLFRMAYRLDTPLQGRLAPAGRALARLLPNLMEWRMLGVGSALTERCPLALRPGLLAPARAAAVAALLGLLDREAAASGATIIAFKDVASPEAEWLAPALLAAGHTAIRSLPVAALDLSTGDAAAYPARLSSATRKDLRRKQRSRAALRIEHRDNIDGIETEIAALYESTRRNSKLRYGEFDELPLGYFAAVAAAAKGTALYVLYWLDSRLIGFNLLLLQRDRVIDKFLGMAYPVAREHNLYVVSWFENIRLALATGRPLLQFGQTAYAEKLRLGCHLVPSTNFAWHASRLVRPMLRAAAPLLAFDRWDPDLRAAHHRRAQPAEG